MTAASTQETNDAGPAVLAAVSAPSNQPEPMIDPSEMKVRPQNPIERFSSCVPVVAALTVGVAMWCLPSQGGPSQDEQDRLTRSCSGGILQHAALTLCNDQVKQARNTTNSCLRSRMGVVPRKAPETGSGQYRFALTSANVQLSGPRPERARMMRHLNYLSVKSQFLSSISSAPMRSS